MSAEPSLKRLRVAEPPALPKLPSSIQGGDQLLEKVGIQPATISTAGGSSILCNFSDVKVTQGNGNKKLCLQKLKQVGIIQATNGVSHSLAEYMSQDRGHSLLSLQVADQYVTLPPSSRLTLVHFANISSQRVILFSSRKKTKVYDPKDVLPLAEILLLEHVDMVTLKREFIPLAINDTFCNMTLSTSEIGSKSSLPSPIPLPSFTMSRMNKQREPNDFDWDPHIKSAAFERLKSILERSYAGTDESKKDDVRRKVVAHSPRFGRQAIDTGVAAGGPSYFQPNHLSSYLQTRGKSLRTYWQTVVDNDFDEAWSQRNDNIQAENAGDHQLQEGDAENEEDENFATCTATWKQIIRKDLSVDVFKRFAQLQEILTNRVAAVSTGAQIAMQNLASGSIHGPTSELNLLTFLPDGFRARGGPSSSSIYLAPIPGDLERKLMNNADLRWFLSQNHLSHMASGSGRHALWRADIPRWPFEGRSSHNLTQGVLRQYATNIKNLWNTRIFNKSLDYLCRFLIRLHLAPGREARRWTQRQQKSSSVTSKSVYTPLRRSLLFKMERLLADLAMVWNPSTQKQTSRKWHVLELIQNLNRQSGISRPVNRSISGTEASDDRMEEQEAEEEEEEEKEEDEELLPLPSDDEVEQEDDKFIDSGKEGAKEREPSAKRLKSLEALLKRLIISPDLGDNISDRDVRNISHSSKRDSLTSIEVETLSKLATRLRPFSPKSNHQGNIPVHMAHLAPLVLLTNAMLETIGYPKFAVSICPSVAPDSLWALSVSSGGLYEILTTPGWDNDEHKRWSIEGITSLDAAIRPEARRSLWGSIFNIEFIEEYCKRHGLTFADRITIVDRETVHIFGRRKNPDRETRPRSLVEERRHCKGKATPNKWQSKWASAAKSSGKSKIQLLQDAKHVAKEIKELQLELAKERRVLVKLESDFRKSRQQYANFQKEIDSHFCRRRPASPQYVEAKQKLFNSDAWHTSRPRKLKRDTQRLKILDMDRKLSEWRSRAYELDKMIECWGAPIHPEKSVSRWTPPPGIQKNFEATPEEVDLSTVFANGAVCFGGRDPGVVKSSVLARASPKLVMETFNRYSVLFGHHEPAVDALPPQSPPLYAMDKEPISSPSQTIADRLKPLRLPDVQELSSKTIAFRSGNRQIMRKRERDLRQQRSVRDALKEISKPVANAKSWSRSSEFVAEFEHRAQQAPILRKFNNSRRRQRASRTNRIQRQKFESQLAIAEQTFLKGAVDGPAQPILFHGAAGTGWGSRIGGHMRRGGRWTREMHWRRSCIVLYTDEFRTSKTCHLCLGKLILARAKTKTADGTKWKRTNGALECINPLCSGYTLGYTVRSRDPQSAFNILVKGAMSVMLAGHQPQGPFSRVPNQTNFTLDASNAKISAGHGAKYLPTGRG